MAKALHLENSILHIYTKNADLGIKDITFDYIICPDDPTLHEFSCSKKLETHNLTQDDIDAITVKFKDIVDILKSRIEKIQRM